MREVHTALSVNEGGWRRGRGESDGNGESERRPRLSMPAETAKQHGKWVNIPQFT